MGSGKRSKPRPMRNDNSDDSDNNSTDNIKPIWDTADARLPSFWLDLQRWIPGVDERYGALVKHGLVP